jgi:hypothetical protein
MTGHFPHKRVYVELVCGHVAPSTAAVWRPELLCVYCKQPKRAIRVTTVEHAAAVHATHTGTAS